MSANPGEWRDPEQNPQGSRHTSFSPQDDPIGYAVRCRIFEGPQHQDDLFVCLPDEKLNTFGRADTEFVRVNDNTMVVHVETDDPDRPLRSFLIKLSEMEDEPPVATP